MLYFRIKCHTPNSISAAAVFDKKCAFIYVLYHAKFHGLTQSDTSVFLASIICTVVLLVSLFVENENI